MKLISAIPVVLGLIAWEASADDLSRELYEAIVYADMSLAREVLGRGGDANGVYDGQTMLGAAARNGATGMVPLLVDAGADVDLADTSGQTPLVHAVAMRDISMAQALLEAGADPNQRTEIGEPVAVVAAKWGDLALAKLLLEAGADLNVADEEGNSALWLLIRYAPEPAMAAGGGLVGLIEMMGADKVDLARGSATQSPLCLARTMGREDVAQALLSAGVDSAQCAE